MTIVVTAAIITRGNELLIAQRKKDDALSLKWEFPGGKVEEGEDPRDCLRREIKEELAMEVAVGDSYDVVFHRYPDKAVLLLFYLCTYQGGRPVAKGCNDFRWVTIEQLSQYQFAPADVPVVEKLQRQRL
ncbi:8-oxo-dGTP diphosphatase MutT [Peptococcaceae bacterium 1198_IL3148]